jgi:hypothetical protein
VINGDPFDIRAERVNSPVEIDDGNPFKSTKTVLVPKTKDSVWLLNPIVHNDRGTKNPIKPCKIQPTSGDVQTERKKLLAKPERNKTLAHCSDAIKKTSKNTVLLA